MFRTWVSLVAFYVAIKTGGAVVGPVVCCPAPFHDPIRNQIETVTRQISDHLLPRTRAYHEIWLDGERVAATPEEEQEPLYGPTYLPRKFKIGLALPPHNDIDVFAQDLGFIAIVVDKKLAGFNVSVGGGMGTTHNDPATYPRLANVIGFVLPEQLLEVAENVVRVQRDFGDSSNRKHARFKYTLDDRGLDWFKAELEERRTFLEREGRVLEAQRIHQRTMFDLEMMKEIGYCHGIENYSRHLSGRAPGEAPPTLQCSEPLEGDAERFKALLPTDRRFAYDMRKIVNAIIDRESFFEIGRQFGRGQIVGLARLAGQPVGIFANAEREPRCSRNDVCADKAEKQAKHHHRQSLDDGAMRQRGSGHRSRSEPGMLIY